MYFMTNKASGCLSSPFLSRLNTPPYYSDSTVVGMKERIWSQDDRQEGQQSWSPFFFFLSQCTVRRRLSLMIENCSVARTRAPE